MPTSKEKLGILPLESMSSVSTTQEARSARSAIRVKSLVKASKASWSR